MTAQANWAEEVLVRRRRDLAHLRTTNVREEDEALATRSADLPDVASEHESAALLERLTERERVELVEIDDALVRIKEGSYGRCRTCSGPIGRQRLRAVPQAPLCITCETVAERR